MMGIRRFMHRLHRSGFWQREDGAVTVDWVVLTAAIAGMAITLFTVITEQHFRDAATKINTDIETAYTRN